jgi:hypothetical protein
MDDRGSWKLVRKSPAVNEKRKFLDPETLSVGGQPIAGNNDD